MRISLRAVLIALIGLVAIGALVTSGALSTVSEPKEATTPAQSGEFCSSEGVSLLIEYGLGSDSDFSLTCVPSFSGNGWELFAAGGQKVEGTIEYPIGFVCRINDYPANEQQPCSSTPTPAQGTWAYYYASSALGDHWFYSASGASSREPACGDVDAWVFINPGEPNHEPTKKPKTFKCED